MRERFAHLRLFSPVLQQFQPSKKTIFLENNLKLLLVKNRVAKNVPLLVQEHHQLWKPRLDN